MLTLLLITNLAYANSNTDSYATLKDLRELSLKHNFKYEIVGKKDISNVTVFKNLTKKQLESLIIEKQSQKLRPLTFSNDVKFILHASVSASYKFETRRFPGEASQTRNWSFTYVDDGEVIQTSSNQYELKGEVLSSATLLSTTCTEQSFSGTVNVGFYVEIAGFDVRIPGSDQNFECDTRYSIELVK